LSHDIIKQIAKSTPKLEHCIIHVTQFTSEAQIQSTGTISHCTVALRYKFCFSIKGQEEGYEIKIA